MLLLGRRPFDFQRSHPHLGRVWSWWPRRRRRADRRMNESTRPWDSQELTPSLVVWLEQLQGLNHCITTRYCKSPACFASSEWWRTGPPRLWPLLVVLCRDERPGRRRPSPLTVGSWAVAAQQAGLCHGSKITFGWPVLVEDLMVCAAGIARSPASSRIDHAKR